MTIIESDVKLFFQKKPGESAIYILESTAIFPDDDYVANGFAPLPTSLNSSNELDIDLIIKDGNNANNSNSSTVIHTISLGNLNFGLDDFKINVYLKKRRG